METTTIIQDRKELQTPKMIRKVLLICGILSSLLYVGTDLLASTLYVGYSFTSQGFSELLAPGSPVRVLALQLSIVYGALMLAFTLCVWLSAGRSRALRITALMLFAYTVDGLVTPTYFPAPMRGAAGAESAGTMHLILTGVEVLALLLAIGFGAAAYRKRFRFYSIGTLLILLAFGALAFSYAPQLAANQPTPWLGVIERVNIYGFLLWVAVLAVVLLRAEKRPGSINSSSA